MKTYSLSFFVAAVALAATCFGCAAQPKVLVSHSFVGETKSMKTLIQRGSDNSALFDLWLRVCDVSDTTTTQNCKDSKVLTNVVPGSVY